MRFVVGLFVVTAALGACADDTKAATGFVSNQRVMYADGRHNENTDLIRWNDKLYLVFRGGESSQIGSPQARLKVWVSSDLGDTWTLSAEIFMPERDIRDPKFVIEADKLVIYAISRIPGPHVRDIGGLAWTVRTETIDGASFTSPPVQVYEETWGFWRFTRHGAKLYATGYDDGDIHVGFFVSDDGVRWQKLSNIYDSEAEVPSEAELQFFGETAVSLVRLDDGASILDEGHTAVCVSNPPYDAWSCDRKFDKRLDGPAWFTHQGRQIVLARKHLPEQRKRSAIYEITGVMEDPQAPLELTELAELTSQGDTAYFGVVPLAEQQYLISWYSTPIMDEDPDWLAATFMPAHIWLAWLDFAKL